MDDTEEHSAPDFEALFGTASGQAGYFTAAQARAAGYSWPLLSYHAGRGRFVRVANGLYRLRDYPSSPREDVVAAWLRLAPDAVVSHESALELLGLSDVVPGSVHLTVPRGRRRLVRQPGVTVHTTTRPLGAADVVTREGVRVTAPERTVVDVAEAGVAPEQVVAAVREGLGRGLTTPARMRAAAGRRSRRVRSLVEAGLAESSI